MESRRGLPLDELRLPLQSRRHKSSCSAAKGLAFPRHRLLEMWVFCRSDYHLATPFLAATARTAAVYKDAKFSDHAPLTIDYGFDL